MASEAEDALIMLDARRRVRRTTPRAAALMGFDVPELLGRNWDELPVPESLRLSTRVQTLQGRTRRDTLHLITLVERQIERPGLELVQPWEASVELALVRGLDGEVRAVNSAFARKFGVAAASWTGRMPASLVHPDDLAGWKHALTQLERPPYRVTHENRWQTAQGWRWLNWEEIALRDDAGVIFAYRSIGRDVTRRHLAEEHFYKLASIVEQSPLSVVLTMPDGRVEYVNPRFTQVSGYTLEEIFERHIEVLRAGFTSASEYDGFLQTVRGGREWRGELCTVAKAGREVWEAVQVSPIRDQSDRITHLLCLREDITERKQLEDQLRQAQKMESLGTLAGGISHDFNNLLAVISGFSEMAQLRCNPDERIGRYLREIQEATRRATGLVRQILTFSRKHEVAMEPMSLNPLVKDLARMLQETFPRTIAFDFELDAELPAVCADHNQMQQIVMNLCVNARDAMPRGGRLVLRTRVCSGALIARLGADAGAKYACIEIEDTGEGMSPAVKARIFEPFFSTKAKNAGTGLGLAVVYGIVVGHGGFLDVDSTPGEGTTFRVYLPLPAEETETFNQDARAAHVPVDFPTGNETVLVVEDEPSLRHLLSTALEGAGYRVFCAADGAEAVDFVLSRSEVIDAVLLDLNLPHVSGVQVRNLLRKSRPEAKVIIVSGHVSAEARAELEQIGEQVFVGKPCHLGDLGRELRRQLDVAAVTT